jgi:hypothetical protein
MHETYQLPSVQGIPPDDGHRKCPKHVEFYDKINFGYLMHLVVCFIRILLRRRVTRYKSLEQFSLIYRQHLGLSLGCFFPLRVFPCGLQFYLEERSSTFLRNAGKFQLSTQCHISEDSILHSHCCNNLRPHKTRGTEVTRTEENAGNIYTI